MKTLFQDAYRPLFLSGWIYAMAGVLVWILSSTGWIQIYPVQYHTQWMIGGFLMSFISGFLMTAIPRFLSAKPANTTEVGMSLSCIFLTVVTSAWRFSLIFLVLSFIFLIVFIFRRKISSKAQPPPFFPFILFALSVAVIGSLGLLLPSLMILPAWVPHFSRQLLYSAFIQSLVLGIGSRLIPALTGQITNPFILMQKKKQFLIALTGFILSWPLEMISYKFGLLIRCCSIFYIAKEYWMIFHPPLKNGFLAISLWLAAWGFVLGQLGLFLSDTYQKDIQHLTFILGFGLLTFLISIRVGLAHGGHGTSSEKTSLWIPGMGFLMLLTAILRGSLAWLPQQMSSGILITASVLWICACLIWGKQMVRILTTHGSVNH
jgi:uncharacterized protein involved in response to NO